MPPVKSNPKNLKGLSFDISDLVLLKTWAEARLLRMVVRLDHGISVEEYQEVLAFHSEAGTSCRWIMWRNATSVFVQPLIGRKQKYGSASHAMAVLGSGFPAVLTDIKATRWPDEGASWFNGTAEIEMLWNPSAPSQSP